MQEVHFKRPSALLLNWSMVMALLMSCLSITGCSIWSDAKSDLDYWKRGFLANEVDGPVHASSAISSALEKVSPDVRWSVGLERVAWRVDGGFMFLGSAFGGPSGQDGSNKGSTVYVEPTFYLHVQFFVVPSSGASSTKYWPIGSGFSIAGARFQKDDTRNHEEPAELLKRLRHAASLLAHDSHPLLAPATSSYLMQNAGSAEIGIDVHGSMRLQPYGFSLDPNMDWVSQVDKFGNIKIWRGVAKAILENWPSMKTIKWQHRAAIDTFVPLPEGDLIVFVHSTLAHTQDWDSIVNELNRSRDRNPERREYWDANRFDAGTWSGAEGVRDDYFVAVRLRPTPDDLSVELVGASTVSNHKPGFPGDAFLDWTRRGVSSMLVSSNGAQYVMTACREVFKLRQWQDGSFDLFPVISPSAWGAETVKWTLPSKHYRVDLNGDTYVMLATPWERTMLKVSLPGACDSLTPPGDDGQRAPRFTMSTTPFGLSVAQGVTSFGEYGYLILGYGTPMRDPDVEPRASLATKYSLPEGIVAWSLSVFDPSLNRSETFLVNEAKDGLLNYLCRTDQLDFESPSAAPSMFLVEKGDKHLLCICDERRMVLGSIWIEPNLSD